MDVILQDDLPLIFNILEEVKNGTVIGEIRAIDEDIGENGAIDYKIICEFMFLLSINS